MSDAAAAETGPAGPDPGQEAQQAEATAGQITFEFEGVTYTVPPTLDWPAAAFEMLGKSIRTADLMRLLLGDVDFDAFLRVPGHTVRSVLELSSAMERAQGLKAGEAPASAGS